MKLALRPALLLLAVSTAALASAQQSDTSPAPGTGTSTAFAGGFSAPSSAVLHNNGTYITGIGNGFGGANTSEVEMGLNTFGYHVGTNGPAEIADDFTIPSGQTWTFTSLKWLTYQTGGPTTGTTTAIFVRVWTTDPVGVLPGGHTYGNATTNRFQSMAFTNVYRVTNTTLTNTQRAVMEVTADLSFLPALGPGTYWLDVSVTGSASFSGPWANVTVPWDAADNGRQAFAGGAFVALNGGVGGAPADFPWQLEGSNCAGPITAYCTAKVSSNGCVPSIGSSGAPSLANAGAFVVQTSSLEQNQTAIGFFSTTGQNSVPFQGGFLCVSRLHYRLPVINSGGTSSCGGSAAYTLADMVANPSGGSLLVPGTQVNVQTWFTDPASGSGTGLSNGLEFTACP